MKKYLFILLLTIAGYGQTYQNPTFGTIKTKTAPTVISVNHLATVEASGVMAKIVPTSNIIQNASIALGATVTDALNTLNSGKEDKSNKAIDLLTINNTLYPSVSAVNKRVNYATPQEYGAVGDGIADDSDAIISCFAANDRIVLYGSYKTSKDLPIRTGQYIYSNNATITRTTTTGGGSLNTIIKAQSVDNWSLQGLLTIVGAGNSNGGQSGLFMQLCKNFRVSGLTIENVSGAGLNFSGFGARGNSGLLNNISLQNNWQGAVFNAGAEYYTITNINASQNTLAISMLGGNNSIIGGSISDNVNGVYVGGTLGNNNSHGVLSGLNINHNTGYNLKAENVEFGESIIGCHFYSTTAELGVNIVNSKGVVFDGCTFDGFLTNSDSNSPKGVNVISNCLFESAFSFSGDQLSFRDCYTKTGGMSDLNNDIGRFTKNMLVDTGTSGANLDIAGQNFGTINFGNASNSNAVPSIAGNPMTEQVFLL